MAYRRKRSFKKRVYKRKSFAPKKKAVRRIVRRELTRVAEKKTAQNYLSEINIIGAGGTANAVSFDNSLRLIGCSPASSGGVEILQGAAQNQRIGNRIKIQSYKLEGTVHATPYHVAQNPQPLPCYVKMALMYKKNAPSTFPSPAQDANIFQLNGGAQGFTNTQTDLWAPYNKDMYVIKATKTFKVGWSSNTGTGALPTYANAANNDFKLSMHYKWDVAKYMVRNVRYNDNNALATTRSLWLMVQAVYANALPVSDGYVPAKYSMAQSMTYTDM